MTMQRIDPPAKPDALPLYQGVAPGSEQAMQQEVWWRIPDEVLVRNVTKPTITPVLPEPGKASGAAVIILPGGGFRMAAIENEGWIVARRLADAGIAAFVLKYRLICTPDPDMEFIAEMAATSVLAIDRDAVRKQVESEAILPIADAKAALEMVRANAEQWGVDTTRVGMLGFSAGAVATLGLALACDAATGPDFIAPIYGPLWSVDVPAHAPPMFAALAADDELLAAYGFGFDLIQSWHEAGIPVELHMYEAGGHGFGSHRKGTTSDQWLDHFIAWMAARKLLD